MLSYFPVCCIHGSHPHSNTECDRMIAFVGPGYFRRVWCVFELASWCRAHRHALDTRLLLISLEWRSVLSPFKSVELTRDEVWERERCGPSLPLSLLFTLRFQSHARFGWMPCHACVCAHCAHMHTPSVRMLCMMRWGSIRPGPAAARLPLPRGVRLQAGRQGRRARSHPARVGFRRGL